MTAQATTLLDYLEAQSVPGRVSTLGEFGVVIPHLAAESVPALESPDATAASVDAREDRLASVLEEGLAAVPDADKLPQADIDEALPGCGQELGSEGAVR